MAHALPPVPPPPPGIPLPEAPDAWSVAPPPKGRTEWILARPDLRLLVVPHSSGRVAVSLLQRRTVLGPDGVLRTRDEHDVLVPEALCPAPLPDETIPGLALRAAGQIVGGEAQALRQALAAAATTWAAFRGDPVVLLADEEGRLLVAHGLPLSDHVLRQTTPAEDLVRRLRLLLLVPAQRHDVLPPWRVLIRAKPPTTGHDRLEASPKAQALAAAFPSLGDLLPH